jgi:hypothetical protein
VWLQSGIEFFTNTAEPTAEAAATNTPGSTETARLIQNNISLSKVAMAVDSAGQGATPLVAELTTSQRIFLPAQVANNIARQGREVLQARGGFKPVEPVFGENYHEDADHRARNAHKCLFRDA